MHDTGAIVDLTTHYLLTLQHYYVKTHTRDHISIVDLLKSVPRSGKLARLRDASLKYDVRSLYDHIVSVSHNLDIYLSLIATFQDTQSEYYLSEKKIEHQLAALSVLHDLNELVIGDAPDYTVQSIARELYMSKGEKQILEIYGNHFLSKDIPIFSIELSQIERPVYDFFHMADKTDPIVAIWRYVRMNIKRIDIWQFADAMGDFFTNPRPLEVCTHNKIRSLIFGLQDRDNLSKYISGKCSLEDISVKCGLPSGTIDLLLIPEMHYTQMSTAPKIEKFVGYK
jgi:hypothetical protein